MRTVATTTLVEARVDRMGATLVRSGEVVLDQGPNRVYVAGIPDDIAKESIRVKFPQSVERGSVRVVDAVASGLLEESKPERERIQRDVDRLERRIENRKAERDLWTRNADFSNASGTTMQERVEFLSQLSSRLDAVDEDVAALCAERDKLVEELNSLRLASLGADDEAGAEPASYILLLEVEAREPGACRFEIQYRIPSAHWTPLYEIHVDRIGDPVTLRLRAEVEQRSGEDWKDVRLLLSSGSAQSSISVPGLRPLYVGVRAPARSEKRGFGFGMGMAAASDSMEPMALEDDAPMLEEPLYEMAAPTVQKTEREIMSTYELSGTWDIESGGQGRIVDISSDSIAADYHLTCVPCEDDGVYLTATLHGLEAIDLYECDASVYLEGSFMGTTAMNPDSTTGDQVVPLGKDERVHVKRKRTRHFTSTPPLLGKTKEESAYEVRVRNLRADAVSVLVKDRIPVSQNKDIEVSEGELSQAALDEKTGILTWEIEVASGEEKVLAFDYAVSYPKNVLLNEYFGGALLSAAQLSVSASRDFCPQCGARVDGSTQYCPTCGAVL